MENLITWMDKKKIEFAEYILDIKLKLEEIKNKEIEIKKKEDVIKEKEKDMEQFRRVSFISSMNKQLQQKTLKIKQLERKNKKLELKLKSLRESKSIISEEIISDLGKEDINQIYNIEEITVKQDLTDNNNSKTDNINSTEQQISQELEENKEEVTSNEDDLKTDEIHSTEEQISKESNKDFIPKEFEKEYDSIKYLFKEIKKNRGKFYKIKKNGKINKKKSGTFKIKKNNEFSLKWT